MAVLTASGSQMAEMNVTPLVDVMLVLLIIFMVTVPTISYRNDIPLFKSDGKAAPIEPLKVHIGAGDTISIDGQPVTVQALRTRFDTEAAKGIFGGKVDPSLQPEVQLSVEPDAEYGLVAQVMVQAKNAHLERVGFSR